MVADSTALHAPFSRPSRRQTLATIIAAAAGVGGGAVKAQEPDANESRPVSYRPSALVIVEQGLEYARSGDRALRLDLHRPIGGALPLRAAAVVVQGGGWGRNSPAGMALVATALAERGVAAASIEFRSAHDAPFPAALEDVRSAIRWMRQNAWTWRIDAGRIAVIGGSSGGHLALLAGVADPRRPVGSINDGFDRPDGVVAMAAPTLLENLTPAGRETVRRFLGHSLDEDPDLWRAASPAELIDRSDPPVLLLHSDQDRAVSLDHAQLFHSRAQALGLACQLRVLPGAPHAFWQYAPWHEDAMNEAAAFISGTAL